MNKVYFVSEYDEQSGFSIAAEDKEEAKQIAENRCYGNIPLDFLRAELQRDKNDEVCKTNKHGVLSAEDIYEIEPYLLWFMCPICGCDDFDFENNGIDEYTCNNCGHTENIPYREL